MEERETPLPGARPAGEPARAPENGSLADGQGRQDGSPSRTGEPPPDGPAEERLSQQDATRYHRLKRGAAILDATIVAGAIVLSLGLGLTHELRDLTLAWTPFQPAALTLYFLIFIGALQLLTAPLDIYSGYVLERRFQLSAQAFGGWLADWLKGFGLQVALGLAAVQAIYLALRWFPETWWLWASIGFVVFVVLLARLAPVLLFPLFFKFEPLEDEDLRSRLTALAERAGTSVRGVFVWKLSEKSSKSNAAVAGWGGTRRIIISDTLLDSHTPDEVEVVLAHELAHQVHNDIWKGLALQVPITFLGFYAIHLALTMLTEPLGFEGIADFANLPLLILVSLAASMLVLPVVNVYSRGRERAADAYALRTTGMREEFIRAMSKLADQNLAQREPHPVLEFLFHSHPSVGRRIAMAREWKD